MAKHQMQVRHKAPTVSKKKYEMAKAAGRAIARKSRQVAAKRVGTVVGALAGAGAGYVERTGKLSPKFTSPLALAMAGGLLAFVVPETRIGRGRLGQGAAEAGSGLLAVAGYKVGIGQPVIGEDDTESSGEWDSEQ